MHACVRLDHCICENKIRCEVCWIKCLIQTSHLLACAEGISQAVYSTVTDFAKFLGWSTFKPFSTDT